MNHSTTRTIFDGALAGLFGAAVIVLWFAAADALRGQTLILPASDLAFQFCALAIIGMATALILDQGERDWELFPALVIFAVVFEIFLITIAMLLGPVGPAALPWWKLIVADFAATATTLACFFRREPLIVHDLVRAWIGAAGEAIVSTMVEVICPRTGKTAALGISQGRLQSCSNWPTGYFDRESLLVEDLLRLQIPPNWPRLYNCDRACLVQLGGRVRG
jgi:hypothetical protein